MNINEHERITKLACRLVNNGSFVTDDQKLTSIMAGVKFNDMRDYSSVGFVIKYLCHSDEFINQSHHGSLQTLHAMDSTGSAKENYIQQLSYAKFCIDVCINTEVNGQRLQDMSLYEYVKNEDENLKTMFYPIFENHSKYTGMTIREFFTGRNKNLDAGFVALGSLAHLVEDSFSNSHAQRIGNILLKNSDILQVTQNQQIAEEYLSNPDKILGVTTKVLLHQNFNEQFSMGLFGKHKHGDRIDATMQVAQGAMQALLSVAYLIRKISEGNHLDAMDFIEKILKVDANALILDDIKQRKKNGAGAELLNQLAEQSDAFAGLDFGKHTYSFTKGGRQYEHTLESTYKYFGDNKGWMKHEKHPAVKKLLARYNSLLNEETYNKIFSVENLIDNYEKQVKLMIEIFASDCAGKEIKERLSNHAMELLVHITGIIGQCADGEADRVARLQLLRDTLVDSMN